MLTRSPMLRLRFPVVMAAALCAAAISGLSGAASAQTVGASAQMFPTRDQPTRSQNMNPQGVSFSDCIHDMTLTFSLIVSGFDGAHNLLVFASKTSDCTALSDRGSGGIAVCWPLPAAFIGKPFTTSQSITYAVRVQDILAWQSTSPAPTTFARGGLDACSTQPTFQPVPINLNFVPTDSSGNSAGTAYQYTLNTDLVGPPAPTGLGDSVGHTLFNVTWTANSDTDTIGYNVFIDPIPGQEGLESGALVDSSSTPVTVCPDTGVPASDTGDDGSEASTDDSSLGTGDDGAPPPTALDAGCHTVNHGGSGMSINGFNCNDPLLMSGITQDSGPVASVPLTDDAGNIIEGGTTTAEGPGGISTIPDANRRGNNPTVSDRSLGQFTITGLTDFDPYTVVVAAVDAFGNTGPPSTEVCDSPAPVKDFWQTYRDDGGTAGGFCALESVGVGGSSVAGVGFLFASAAYARRRRRRPQPEGNGRTHGRPQPEGNGRTHGRPQPEGNGRTHGRPQPEGNGRRHDRRGQG
jgi:hypothetical protein